MRARSSRSWGISIIDASWPCDTQAMCLKAEKQRDTSNLGYPWMPEALQPAPRRLRGARPSEAVRAAAVAAKAAKARDRAADVLPTIREIQASGIASLSGIARELNARGVPTLRGGSEWQAVQVRRVLRAAPDA